MNQRLKMIESTPLTQERASEPVAIIDIGSNSVRLVIFDGLSRIPVRIFDERYNCALAKNHIPGQALSQDKLDAVYQVLTRFSVIADQARVRKRWAVATASIREASNSKTFIEKASLILKTDIEIASGEREAKLLALGIKAGFCLLDAVAADLGGGSMEIIRIGSEEEHVPPEQSTFPLGVLRNQQAFEANPEAFLNDVDKQLESTAIIKAMKGKPLVLVGGSWRALGRILFARQAPPFAVLHQFCISNETALNLADELTQKPISKIDKIKVVQKSRRPHLKLASALLKRLIILGEPSELIVSCTGIREGLLASKLAPNEAQIDPLIASARALAAERLHNPAYGEALYPFVRHFMELIGWPSKPQTNRLIHAAALFANCHWRIHPDHRGREALNDLTHMYAYGLSSEDRLFLGVCLLVRHDGKLRAEHERALRPWMDKKTRTQATQVGLIMRLAQWLSTSSPEAISSIMLKHEPENHLINIILDSEPFATEPPFVSKAQEKLSAAVDITIKVTFNKQTNQRMQKTF